MDNVNYIRRPKRGEARSLETVDGCWTYREGRGDETWTYWSEDGAR